MTEYPFQSARLFHLGAQSVTIKRNGMAMSLNNDDDEISLFNANHILVDRFTYTGSQQGIWIQTGH